MRVLYTDPPWAVNQGHLDPDRASIERDVFGPDITIDFGPFDKGFITSGPRLLEQLRDADAAVIYRAQVTEEFVAALPAHCRVVARSGVGVDNLNTPLLESHRIASFNVPDYCGDEVSSHTLALLLALERGLLAQHHAVVDNAWSIYAGRLPRRMASRHLGILGLGRIGRATARKAAALYDSISAYDPAVSADQMRSYGVHPTQSSEQLFSSSDAVVVHCSLTDANRGLINTSLLSQAGPGALLVNTARGALVDDTAVLNALREGQLGGFASDVFSPEDPNATDTGRALLARDDVIVTAHRAFLSEESERSLRRRVAEGVLAQLRAPVR